MLSVPIQHQKPAGHALVVGNASACAAAGLTLSNLGYEVDQRDDPYTAMLELCRRPLVFRAIVLSLQGLYRNELAIISTVRRRFPHISIWLTHTDGRHATLVEAMRLGAEAAVTSDGIQPFNAAPSAAAPSAAPQQYRPIPQPQPAPEPSPVADHRPTSSTHSEPVLTADELRALLGDDV